MGLTKDQKRAVEANGDVCVTAGAGTGKTHMLSARYLQLLRAHNLSPLEIVATTFTEMAASELRARIRKDVVQALPPFAPEVAAELEAAPILTMHALAARICREHPDAAGVPADFSILEERPEGPIWAMEQLDEALSALPTAILQNIPSGVLRSALEAFLADPLTAEQALACNPDDLLSLLEAERGAIRERLVANPEWQDAVNNLRGCAGVGEREQQRLEALAAVDALACWQPREARPDLTGLVGINLNKGKGLKGWDPDQHRVVSQSLKVLRELIKAEPLLLCDPGEADEHLAAMVPALRQAFTEVSSRLNLAKARERVLDFGDLEVHALRALEKPEVLSYYRSRWRAFLLDEVQDTNPIQARLLDQLTEGAILTIVGDEKQSIYGFRRADVAVFGRMARAIEARGGDRVNLGESFRSHAPLVEIVNRVCGPSLGNLRQDLLSARPEPHPGPHIAVATVPKDMGADVEARRRIEARFIARQLKAWFEQGLLVHDKPRNQLRPIKWGDVAMLCRTGAPLALYEEALAAEGIPTAMARGSDLLATREALDGTALLRFLADPRDDQALVALLRSPFFAISDGLLHQVADRRGALCWWEAIGESVEPELAPVQEALTPLLRQRQEGASRLLQLADQATGFSAVLSAMPGARRRLADWSGFIDCVRHLEEGAMDVLTVVRRIHRLSEGEVEIERPALEAGNAVVLMTIHASKGLEWPVVVVPNLTAGKPADSTKVRFDAELGVALKFQDEEGESLEPLRFQLLKGRQREREEAEERRIFYVALTRARDRVLLTAPDPVKGALGFLMPGIEAAGLTVAEILPQPGDERPPLPGFPPAPPVPARWIERPLGAGLTEIPVTALAVYARCPRAFAFRYVEGHPGAEVPGPDGAVPVDDAVDLSPPLPVPTPHANRVGTAAHLALELDLEDESTLARQVPDLSPDLIAAAMDHARTFRTAPVFQSVREAIVERERPITLRLQGLELQGVVDALGKDFVLDYKTDRVMDPDHHAMQLWAYTKALGRPRAYLAYLQHGELVELSSNRLEAAGVQAKAIARAITDSHFEATPKPANCQGCAYGSICPYAPGQHTISAEEEVDLVREGKNLSQPLFDTL